MTYGVFETKHLTTWRTSVWCGLIINILLGPYFYDGTLNGRQYLKFVMNDLPIMLNDIPLATRDNLILQQNGALAHNAIFVHNYLNYNLENRWMELIVKLNGLHDLLISHPKTVVYTDIPISLINLKNNYGMCYVELQPI